MLSRANLLFTAFIFYVIKIHYLVGLNRATQNDPRFFSLHMTSQPELESDAVQTQPRVSPSSFISRSIQTPSTVTIFTSSFPQEGCPFSNKPSRASRVWTLGWSFVTRKNVVLWWSWDTRKKEVQTHWAPGLFIICQQSICTKATILWTGKDLTSFSCNVKSSSDIRIVLCDVYRTDRSSGNKKDCAR